MMRVLVLGGNSVSNKPWCSEICASIKEQNIAENAEYITYNHWENEELKMIDFGAEEKRLIAWVEKSEEPYKIVCKSAGSLLFLSTISKIITKPLFVLICGLPLRFSEKLSIQLDAFLQDYEFPVALMQNESDPEGSFGEVQEKIAKNTNWKLVKLAGESHYYKVLDIMNNLEK